jgi:hypothetical protein
VAEIAVRQILFPAAWTTRRQRREAPQEPVTTYAYGELEAIVHRRAEERRRRGAASRDSRGVLR